MLSNNDNHSVDIDYGVDSDVVHYWGTLSFNTFNTTI